MRKMFSKNQIEVITKNVLENLSAPDFDHYFLKFGFSYDLTAEKPYLTEGFEVDSPEAISFIDSEDSLQDKLDEKSGKLYIHHIYVADADETEILFNVISTDSASYQTIAEVPFDKIITPLSYNETELTPLLSIGKSSADNTLSGTYIGGTFQNFVVTSLSDSVRSI